MIIKCPCRSQRVHDANKGTMRVMESIKGSWRVRKGHRATRRFNESPVGFMVRWSIRVLVF